MGSRHISTFVGAVILACAIACISVAVQPERAGATTAVKTCSGEGITLKTREKRVFVLHNEARVARGLKPLCIDARLMRAARSHSREMIKKDYFSHPSFDGESVGERLKRFGYHGRTHAENLAGGYGTFGGADSTFRRWMNSQGHRANILDSRFRKVGVGTYTGNYKGKHRYTMYTVDLGVRR